MKIDVLTIFPEFFREVFDFGIIRRAKVSEIVEIRIHDIREFTTDKHRMTDDRPFGGGDGMVFKPEPIFNAIESILGTCGRENYPPQTKVVLLTPQGRVLKQAVAKELADETEQLVLICGRYEGVDERVSEALVTDEISIGDYVLSGGEPAAIVMVDAIVRLRDVGRKRLFFERPARLPALHAAARFPRNAGAGGSFERESCRNRKMASAKSVGKNA
jgi:tRNA (guanine37-N1)-methyltransferase